MAISNVTALNLGKFLQIAYSEGVRSQISEDYRDWEMIKQVREGDPDGRQLNFLFQTAFGPAAIQYSAPGSAGEFPDEHQVTTSEHTAIYKELDATIGIEYSLWNRARKAPAKYAEPLAIEIQSKAIASKRRMAADLYGDGTGVVAQCASSGTVATVDGSDVKFQLDGADDARGHLGFCEFGDIYVIRQEDGSATSLDTNLATEPVYWKVMKKDRKNNTVTLRGLDSSFGELSVASISVDADADSVFFRYKQPTGGTAALDLTAAVADYGTVTEVVAGLESLISSDGRTIHGITMEGANSATTEDCEGNPLDVTFIQSVMDQAKINVGRSIYTWKKMCMAPEAHAVFIESRETDRRFNSREDAARGIRVFGFQHEDDFLESYTTEYCPKKRLYLLPEAKSGKKVLEYHGTDFEPVRIGNMPEFHLRPGSNNNHQRRIVTYMEALGALICKHPAACARLNNFTL